MLSGVKDVGEGDAVKLAILVVDKSDGKLFWQNFVRRDLHFRLRRRSRDA